MPAAWALAHHEPEWEDGGLSDPGSCLLLCERHHAARHLGGWTLAIDEDATVTVTNRAGATWTETAAQSRARHALGHDPLDLTRQPTLASEDRPAYDPGRIRRRPPPPPSVRAGAAQVRRKGRRQRAA
jgi:hypothetical protein